MATNNSLEQNTTPSETITGHIERITFHSEDTGFCVLRLKARGHRDLVTLVANAIKVNVGEYVEATGSWINNAKYGQQFKASQMVSLQPTTVEGIERYLASGAVRGIGAFFAKKIVEAFGAKVFEVLDDQPSKILSVGGIGEKRLAMIAASWQEQREVRSIMAFLQAHGVGAARAARIYKTYGQDAITKVRDNPYCLAQDISGIGFQTADLLAKNLGITQDSMLRVRAGVHYALQELANAGNCGALINDLTAKCVELLGVPESLVSEAIDQEVASSNLCAEEVASGKALYLPALFYAECAVAKNLLRLKNGAEGMNPWGYIDCAAALNWAEAKVQLEFSLSQKHSIETAIKNKVVVITGGPGVGKTTIVNSIIKILHAKKMRVALCAPTGRAAKRLSAVTGMQAKTIHRLLRFDPQTRAFVHNASNPLSADFVVVDEASMIDIVLMQYLLRAIPDNAALLIVGDIDQLPAVGPGMVLADIIQSQVVPTVTLTEIFRQAANSRIIVNAHRINHGEFPMCGKDFTTRSDFYLIPAEDPEEIATQLTYLATEFIPKQFGFDPITDIQVLTPMHRGNLGSRALNANLQTKLNAGSCPQVSRFGWTFAPGDKVMQNVNNYDKDVFNGDIGVVSAVDSENAKLRVNFGQAEVEYSFDELDELGLAYAISIHKSQGSEYPVVVIPITTQHYLMLARNLIYTAVTRGKKLVVLVGQQKALAIAVQNVRPNQRFTNLCARLVAMR